MASNILVATFLGIKELEIPDSQPKFGTARGNMRYKTLLVLSSEE
jgi:hypothetical protein